MNTNTITQLRREGKLEEAYLLGRQLLERKPSDLYIHRALAWVLYEQSKAAVINNNNPPVLLEKMKETGSLMMGASEDILWKSYLFLWGKYLRGLHGQQPQAINQAIRSFFTALSPLPLTRAGEGYSFLLSALLTHKKELSPALIIEFIDWWDLGHLSDTDFQPPPLPDGKRNGMALAERAYIAYAAALEALIGNNPAAAQAQWRERLQAFLPKLKQLTSQQPTYLYPPYFLGKLLLLQGDRAQALQYFIPFAIGKQRDFWVWDLLSELYPPTSDQQIACLCRALLCKTDAIFLVKVRQKLVKLLLQRQAYPEARAEVDQLRAAYTRKGYPLPPAVKKWENEDWYTSAQAGKNNNQYYRQYQAQAEALLLSELPKQEVVVLAFDYTNKQLDCIDAAGQRTQVKYFGKEKIIRNSCYRLWLSGDSSDGSQQLLHLQPMAADEGFGGLKKRFAGKMRVLGSGDALAEDVFIPSMLLTGKTMSAGQKVAGVAVRSWDNSKRRAGWRCVELEAAG